MKVSSEIYSTNEDFMVCKSVLYFHLRSCTNVAEVTFCPKSRITVVVAKISLQELMLEVIS